MRVYIAGSFVAQHRLRGERDRLFHAGFETIGTWLEELRPSKGLTKEQFDRQLAYKDFAEVRSCDIFILDTMEPSTTGGRYCELGIATAAPRLKIHVGPRSSIFEYLCDIHFETWEEVHQYLATISPKDVYVATGMEGKSFTPSPGPFVPTQHLSSFPEPVCTVDPPIFETRGTLESYLSNGWVAWTNGQSRLFPEGPEHLSGDTRVSVLLRGFKESEIPEGGSPLPIREWRWTHEDTAGDIIAYRISDAAEDCEKWGGTD